MVGIQEQCWIDDLSCISFTKYKLVSTKVFQILFSITLHMAQADLLFGSHWRCSIGECGRL